MSNIINNNNNTNSYYKKNLEDVAKILLERKTKLLEYNKINNDNQNKKNKNKGTIRDSLSSIFSAFKKNNTNQNNNYNLTYSYSNKKENKFHRYIKHKSSEFTKSTENISNNSNSSLENLFLNNNNNENNNINKYKLTLTGKLEKKNLKKNEIVEEENYSSSSLEKEEYNFFNNSNNDNESNNNNEIYEIVNSLVNEENIEQIKNLYDEIIIEFKNSKNKKEDENSLLKKKMLAYDYMKFIFGEDISTIITQHSKNIEIIEFILYQIYYYISILYFKDENLFHEDIIMSYLTGFIYSSTNFNIISEIVIEENIQDLTISQNMLKTQNKIIKSIIPKISLFIPAELINILQSNRSIKFIINNLFKNSLLNNKLNNIEQIAMKIIEENKFLPEMNKNKYIYSLILDLDETLVHYIEEDNRAYVKVRYGVENFLSELSKIFEIIIFTENTKEYADIILDNIDPEHKFVSYRLYRDHIMNNNIKNIIKIGRDLDKTIIIDNDENCFSMQKENGLKIKNFNGEEEDRELIYLKNDLLYLVNKTIKDDKKGDIRRFLPEIQKKMNDRYNIYN